MKKLLCVILAFLMFMPYALAQGSEKTLPQKDENGKTVYDGSVGKLLDAEGNIIKESLFDEAVLWIEEMPYVYDVSIATQEEETFWGGINLKLSIAIVVSPTLSEEKSKELADASIKLVGTLFAQLDGYEGPSEKTYGTLFDEYSTLIGVFTKSGTQICMGAIAKTAYWITW